MAKSYLVLRMQMSQAAQRQAEAQANALLAEDGWSLWAFASPYTYQQVELMRPEWRTPLRVDPWTLHPLMNVCDLYWRPVDDALPVVRWRQDDTCTFPVDTCAGAKYPYAQCGITIGYSSSM